MVEPIRLPSAKELLASLRLAGKLDEKQKERRASKRVSLVCPATMFETGGEGPRRVATRTFDISTGGVGFEADHPITPGAKFLLRLDAPGATKLFIARCAYSVMTKAGYKCGAAFVKVFSSAEIPKGVEPMLPEFHRPKE